MCIAFGLLWTVLYDFGPAAYKAQRRAARGVDAFPAKQQIRLYFYLILFVLGIVGTVTIGSIAPVGKFELWSHSKIHFFFEFFLFFVYLVLQTFPSTIGAFFLLLDVSFRKRNAENQFEALRVP